MTFKIKVVLLSFVVKCSYVYTFVYIESVNSCSEQIQNRSWTSRASGRKTMQARFRTEAFPPIYLNWIFQILHTTQNSQNNQTKIPGLETNIFQLKMMVKSGLDFFFEILLAPSELSANLPGQFSLSGHIFCTGQQQL